MGANDPHLCLAGHRTADYVNVPMLRIATRNAEAQICPISCGFKRSDLEWHVARSAGAKVEITLSTIQTTKENEMPDMSNARDWDKKDEYNDRGVTERPVSQTEVDQTTTVDAVPGLWYRPGRRN